jgi:hypothetical protein
MKGPVNHTVVYAWDSFVSAAPNHVSIWDIATEERKRQVLPRSVSFTSCLIFDAPLVVWEEPSDLVELIC